MSGGRGGGALSSWMAMLLASAAVAGCGGGDPEVPGAAASDHPADGASPAAAAPGSPAAARGVPYERAKQVQEQRTQEIFRRYEHVQGVGITKVVGELTAQAAPADPVWGIAVFVAGAPPAGRHSIDGVPLKFTVTGVFRPLDPGT